MGGTKSVKWDVDNRAKFFDALLYHVAVRVDEEAAQAIGEHVGESLAVLDYGSTVTCCILLDTNI